jgi:hypothetical protein
MTLTDWHFTPIGYQGPAQHTAVASCDGFHEPGQCKAAPVEVAFR